MGVKLPNYISKNQDESIFKTLVSQNYFTSCNLYKRALLTLQSPSTKTSKQLQVTTILVPTLTSTPSKKSMEPNGFKIARL